jgi:hypothetical protein
MKKLPRLDMDSMAQEFRLLSDAEQARCLGGVHYYDDMGQYLGKFGESNELRILNNSYEVNEIGSLSSTSTGEINETLGSVFSQSANGIARNSIIRKYLTASYEGPIYGLESYIDNVPGGVAAFVGQIFNYKQNDTVFDDYNNLQNIMAHESYHWNSGHTTPGLTDEQRLINEADTIFMPGIILLIAVLHRRINGL